VCDITNAYPPSYGFNFGRIRFFRPDNLPEKERRISRNRLVEVYPGKGTHFLSWRFSNPVPKGSFFWKNSPVKTGSEMLPSGSDNPVFNECRIKTALFAASLK